jgi:hypothetical protein
MIQELNLYKNNEYPKVITIDILWEGFNSGSGELSNLESFDKKMEESHI